MALKRTAIVLLLLVLVLGVVVWILPKNAMLAAAAQKGDVGQVNLMISLGAKPNGYSNGNLTPLNYAIRAGHVDVVKRLLQAGANVNLKGGIGDATERAFFAPIEDVINYQPNNIELLKVLLQAGANSNDYFTLVHAVENENVEALKLLLDAGADKAKVAEIAQFYQKPEIVALSMGQQQQAAKPAANQTQTVNQPATPETKQKPLLKYSEQLINAAESGDLKKVKQLIENGADPNSQNQDIGITPLTQAALYGRAEVVKFLLQHGADPNLRDKEYNGDALGSAIAREPTGQKNEQQILVIVNALIKAGADVNNVSGGPEATSTTALLDATVNGYVGVVKALLQAGAKPEAQDQSRNTPLWYAAYTGDVEITKSLLGAGANPEIANVNGKKPIDVAREGQHVEVFRLLQTKGVGSTAGSNQGNRSKDELNAAMLNATISGNADGVKKALDGGADPNFVYDNCTILFIATENNHSQIVKLLLDAGADYTIGTRQATPLLVAEQENYQEIIKLLRDAGATD